MEKKSRFRSSKRSDGNGETGCAMVSCILAVSVWVEWLTREDHAVKLFGGILVISRVLVGLFLDFI